ncbi:MAG: VOC family protein [Actinomycetia bacterium]|nr:VOC family protein [Actinomycetes bacterium]
MSIWFWFDGEITGIEPTPEGTPFPAGQVMTPNFWILGHDFNALNGGPQSSTARRRRSWFRATARIDIAALKTASAG